MCGEYATNVCRMNGWANSLNWLSRFSFPHPDVGVPVGEGPLFLEERLLQKNDGSY